MKARGTARWAALLLLPVLAAPGRAEGPSISDAWIRLMPGGGPSAGYFRLENTTGARLILEGAHCPGFGRTTLHRSIEEGGTSRMEHVESLPVPAGETVAFRPGGYHMMLMEPTDPPKVGTRLTCRLRLADRESVRIELAVEPPYGRGP